jgi:23S rRNA (cytidine1920-2'-O)/16S rRNA (cytidine1409-2'-O)-methyltransferase
MKRKPARRRLDDLLVGRGLAESLQRAAAMILAGEVQVDGKCAEKAGLPVADDARVDVTSRQRKYVSRGGFKLEGALHDFSIDPAGCICVDIGSAHGGFTDCLLQHGASRVYAVDVSVEQLDWKLRQDGRVIPILRNARDLRLEDVPERINFVTIDVSFISVRKVIASAVMLAAPGAVLLILVKPQFELRREEISRGGIVKDEKLQEKAILAVRAHLESLGLEYLGIRPSCLAGAEGNQEYFLHARKKSLG